MITIEQVEELRKRVNVSYEEAKAALEEANGDMLEAVINLERKNKITPPEGGGFYSTRDHQNSMNNSNFTEGNKDGAYYKSSSISFSELLKRFLNFCKKVLEKGNKNSFQVIRDGKIEMVIPVTLLALLIIFCFWITIPVLVLGLFLGYRYAFSGPDLGKENINSVMDTAANVAESIKKEVKGEKIDGEDSNNRG
jgi:hypothetical protein